MGDWELFGERWRVMARIPLDGVNLMILVVVIAVGNGDVVVVRGQRCISFYLSSKGIRTLLFITYVLVMLYN